MVPGWNDGQIPFSRNSNARARCGRLEIQKFSHYVERWEMSLSSSNCSVSKFCFLQLPNLVREDLSTDLGDILLLNTFRLMNLKFVWKSSPPFLFCVHFIPLAASLYAA